MVNEPISGSFLLMLPAIQIVRSFKTEEEKRYYIIQAIFALFAMTLTYSVGIWLGQVKPLILILPAGFALAILYRIYFKKEKTDERWQTETHTHFDCSLLYSNLQPVYT